MRTTRQISITLPHEMADLINRKVKAGEYASESEVIRDGVRALLARDRAIDQWLQTEVANTFDAMQRDPGSGINGAELRQMLNRMINKA